MIYVDNLKSRQVIGAHEIYVGRKMPGHPGSPLGNPFKENRKDAIVKFRIWLWEQIKANSPASKELKRIATFATQFDIVLLCWCAPEPCHAEVIRNAAMWMIRNEKI